VTRRRSATDARCAGRTVLTEPVQQKAAAGPASRNLRRRKSATPYKVVLYHCQACQETEVVTSSGRRQIDQATAAAVIENATIHDRGKNRSAIPPAVREAVLARDGHRCQATCFLELHHRRPREQGGTHEPGNLVTLCSRCHRYWHRRPEHGAEADRVANVRSRAQP
jgi:hypothetical protein